jgi:hypothetical protein
MTAGKHVGFDVVFASFPMDRRSIFFDIQAPAEHLLLRNVSVSQICMVGPDVEAQNKENGARLHHNQPEWEVTSREHQDTQSDTGRRRQQAIVYDSTSVLY